MADSIEWYTVLNEIRAATDSVGSQDPPDGTTADPGLNSLANRSFKRLYDKIVEATPQDWVFATSPITTVAGQQDYDLTTLIPDLYRFRFLDMVTQTNANSQSKINLVPYTVDERNLWLFGQANLIQGGIQLLVNYSPKAPYLQEYATLTLNSANGIDGLLFTAVSPGNIGLNVSIQITVSGANTTVTIPVSPYAVVLNVKSGGDTIKNILTAFQNSVASPVVTASSLTSLQTDSFTAVVGATKLGGNVAFDFVSGWQDYVISATAAKLMGRLDLDPTFHLSESVESLANVSAMSAVRDSGHSDSIRDEEVENLGGYPFASPAVRTIVYRPQGSTLSLRAIWPNLPFI